MSISDLSPSGVTPCYRLGSRISIGSFVRTLLLKLPIQISVLFDLYISLKARVFQGIDVSSGMVVAIKQFRVSVRHTRPLMRYESRIMQLIQGHPSVPMLLGYSHPPHFEYIAMELLGASLYRQVPRGAAAQVGTVIRFTVQMVSASVLRYG